MESWHDHNEGYVLSVFPSVLLSQTSITEGQLTDIRNLCGGVQFQHIVTCLVERARWDRGLNPFSLSCHSPSPKKDRILESHGSSTTKLCVCVFLCLHACVDPSVGVTSKCKCVAETGSAWSPLNTAWQCLSVCMCHKAPLPCDISDMTHSFSLHVRSGSHAVAHRDQQITIRLTHQAPPGTSHVLRLLPPPCPWKPSHSSRISLQLRCPKNDSIWVRFKVAAQWHQASFLLPADPETNKA